MPDVIDVIKGLEEVKHFIKCENLPAHSLKAKLVIDDALALLKAQEPMQIIKVGYYDHGRCPKCGRYVSRYSNFCWYCGQAVKWE